MSQEFKNGVTGRFWLGSHLFNFRQILSGVLVAKCSIGMRESVCRMVLFAGKFTHIVGEWVLPVSQRSQFLSTWTSPRAARVSL